MGVPRESREVVLRALVAKVVQQEEGIEIAGVPEAECPAQFDARALDGRLRLHDSLDRPDGHGCSSSESCSRSRSEEHTSELQSLAYLVCRLLLEKKKKKAKCCT